MNTRTHEQTNRTEQENRRTDEQNKTGGVNMNRRTEQTNRTDEHNNNNNNNNIIGGANMKKLDISKVWHDFVVSREHDKTPIKRETDFNAMANNINMLLSNGNVQDIAIYDFAMFCVFSVFKFLIDQNRNNVKNTEKSNDKITLDNIPYGIVSYDFARKACVIKSKSILDYKIMGDTIDDNFDYVHDAYITILQEAKKQLEKFGNVRLFRRYVVKRTYRHMSEHHKLITKYVDTTIYKEAMRTVRNNIENLKRRIEQTDYMYFDVTSRYENMQDDVRIYRRTKSLQYMPYGEFNSLHELMCDKGDVKDEYQLMYAFIYDMKLSPIELETLKYILQGDSRQVVAEKLNVSKGTINSYMQRIKEKALKCDSIIEYMPTLIKVKEDIEQKKHEQKEKDEQKKIAKKLEKEKEFKH